MKFNIGDWVQMPGVPIRVQVLEFGTCDDGADCPWEQPETFRFKDPNTGRDDWMHTFEFEKVED